MVRVFGYRPNTCRPVADDREDPRNKERGTRVKERAKNGASKIALSFFGSRFISRAAKTTNPFLGPSLLRNQTETLSMQANNLLRTDAERLTFIGWGGSLKQRETYLPE